MNSDNEPELVDLGFPSGNLWMKCNLGALIETDLGLYYQWGSTVGYQGESAKNHSTWKTCPFNNGKDDSFDEEYFKANRHRWIYKNGILRPEFDIVTQTYGKDYRMPEPEDFRELMKNTTSKFIKNYKNSGKNGKLFTSKVNGKILFVPYSGLVWNGIFDGVGDWCSLWSGRLCSGDPLCAYCLHCNSDDASLRRSYYYDGFALRGIKVRNE